MRGFWIWLGALVILVAGLIVMLGSAERSSTNGRFTVVTTFHPLTSLTEPVAGQAARVVQLLPSGQGVHDYRPTPSDLRTIQEADLLITNGANLEDEWLGSLLESADRRDLPTLNLAQSLESADVTLLEGEPDEHDSNLEPRTSNLVTDPHIWLSPKNAIIMAKAIRDALAVADPISATVYSANANQLIVELEALHLDAGQAIETRLHREFIAFHNAFSYFARDYGLEQVGTIELTPGEAPTPGQVAEIRRLVGQYKLTALFGEPQFSPALVDQLAEDLGLTVYELDPLETGEEGYVAGMRRNLETLRKALELSGSSF